MQIQGAIRKTSPEGVAFIADWEQLRLVAYDDGYGYWTIGYGRTKDVHPGMTCTKAEALAWFAKELTDREEAVNRHTGGSYLSQHQFDALVSFCFNAGIGALGQILRDGLSGVPKYLPLYNKARNKKTGKLEVSRGNVRRRAEELAMFLKPDKRDEKQIA